MTAALALTLLVAPAIPVGEIPPAPVLNDLADAPPAWDRYRFPDSPAAEWALRFNARFAENIGREREQWPEERHQAVFDVTLREAAALREAWSALAWAQWHTRSEWRRRLDLKRLRDLIGREAYEAGVMPEVVPSWRCRELR